MPIFDPGGSSSTITTSTGTDLTGVLYANATDIDQISNVAAGQVLTSGAPPAWTATPSLTDLTLGNDLLLASASIINFNSGDVTITHSANTLTLAGGKLVLTSAETGVLTLPDANASIQAGSQYIQFSAVNSGDIFFRPSTIGGGWSINPTGLLAYAETTLLGWPSGAAGTTRDTAIERLAAGVVGINNGTAGTTGALVWARRVTTAASGTTTINDSESGGLFANTGTSGTTTFTLPAAATGLCYCFVEAGDGAGELLINVQTGDNIVGKTDGGATGTGVATAAGTGIKNTAATNVKGDFVCLTAVDATTWLMTSVAGIWASQ